MNRIVGRSRVLIALILVMALGMGLFVGEYAINSGTWILFPGSPHIYNGGNLGCGVIADRDNTLLLDLSGGRTYSNSLALRQSVVHWTGDRQGNISVPALSHYASQIVGYDPVQGAYAYGGTGGIMTLSLSAQVQIAAQQAMGDYKGTIAVYNYKTGELLCAVTTPNFDPENPPTLLGEDGTYEGLYVNRFTQSTYTPGSIFKIVTAAAALETIEDIEGQSFTCQGTVHYGTDTVTCESAHGTLTFRQAFSRSCNCAFAQIADQLGGQVLERYAKQFGILDSLSFDGITTAAGSIQSRDAAAVQVAWSAIGQHKDLINPCSYMAFLGAIANDGVEVSPYLVKQISAGGKVTHSAASGGGDRILSSKTAKALQEMLRTNVRDYYGDDSFPGLTVCAKSGTAEVGGGKKPNAMFTGFVADEAYPLAFIVCIEDGGYGRPVCVPVLSQVLEACVEALS